MLQQKQMDFELPPEVEQHLLPEHKAPKDNRWRKGLPKNVTPQPLDVNDFIKSVESAHIIQVED